MSARGKYFEHQHNQLAWAVWHVAVLSRSKKIPELSRLLANSPKASSQTIEQQKYFARMWTVAMGGSLQERKH